MKSKKNIEIIHYQLNQETYLNAEFPYANWLPEISNSATVSQQCDSVLYYYSFAYTWAW